MSILLLAVALQTGVVDMQKIPADSKDVVAQIAAERGLTLVLEKDARVVYAADTIDITADVLKRVGARKFIAQWKAKDEKLYADARKAPLDLDDARGLFDKAAEAHDGKDYKSSVPGFKSVVYALFDGDKARVRLAAGSAYNAACGYALEGKKEEALDFLEISVGLGWLATKDQCHDTALAHLEADADLASLREEPRYKDLVKRSK